MDRSLRLSLKVAALSGMALVGTPNPKLAIWYRQNIASDFGPTFTKIGQLGSSRPDILGMEAAKELDSLTEFVTPECLPVWVQDRIPFELESRPVGSASVGQVHQSACGKYAVKYIKKGVRESLDADFELLESLSSLTAMVGPTATEVRALHNILAGEMDLRNEALNMKRFLDVSQGDVRIPRVLDAQKDLLLMENIPHHSKLTSPDEANRLILLFLKQLDMGVVHCDPHLGNMGLTKEGDMVLYDFGSMADLGYKPGNSHGLREIGLYLVQGDLPSVRDKLISMGIVVCPESQSELFVDYLRYVFIAMRTGEVPHGLKKIEKIRKFTLTQEWGKITRSMMVLDGTAKRLNHPGLAAFLEKFVPPQSVFTPLLEEEKNFLIREHYKDIEEMNHTISMLQSLTLLLGVIGVMGNI